MLCGRTAELELLEGWLRRETADGPQVMLVEGEAGVGKTHLVDVALHRAAGSDLTTLVCRGDALEQARPFGPLAAALLEPTAGSAHPERDELVRLLRSGGVPDRPLELDGDPGLQFRLVDGFVDLIEEIAFNDPVLLVVDDLQWADPSTVLTVNSLTRRLGYLNVSVLATLRPLPRSADLARLLDALLRAGAHHLILEPLDDQATTELVAHMAGAPPGPALSTAVAGASGNPLFVTELLGALQAEDAIEVVDGHAEIREVSLPPSLRLTILRRLGFLGADALDVLQHASVLGSTFSLRDVATVLRQPVPELARILQEPIRAGLLVEENDRLRFRHDLIRDAIYMDLLEDVRCTLHREAGRRLAADGAPSLQVAEHLVLGAQPGDSDAIGWLHTAARTAGQQAPSTAVHLLERALGLTFAADGLRVPILADLVPTLLWSGRPHDAESRAREALAEVPSGELEGTLRLGLVQALSAQGRHRDLIDEVDRTLDGIAVDPDVRSRLHAEVANAHLLLGDLANAAEAAGDAVAVGSPAHSDGAESGLLVLADIARGRGHLEESLEHAQNALQRTEERRRTRRDWRPEIFVAMALRSLDRFDDADRAIQRGRAHDERVGNMSYLPVYDYELATGRFLDGRWDEAAALAEAGLALADEISLATLRSWPSGLLALIAVHRGNLEAADRWVATGGEGDAQGSSARTTLACALLAEATGDTAGALTTLRAAWDHHAQRDELGATRVLGPDLARIAITAGERSAIEGMPAHLEEAARRAPVASLEAVALRCRGLVDDDPDLLLRSVDLYRSGPRTFECAQACLDAAEAVARTGQDALAATLFDEALDTFEDVGAQRASARALATMRALGVGGRARRGARSRPAYGWESLTPSELEVVRLAAEGLTNPEIGQRLFISRRTVQTHLSHAFRKLDVSSRVELAAQAARRGGVPDPPSSR